MAVSILEETKRWQKKKPPTKPPTFGGFRMPWQTPLGRPTAAAPTTNITQGRPFAGWTNPLRGWTNPVEGIASPFINPFSRGSAPFQPAGFRTSYFDYGTDEIIGEEEPIPTPEWAEIVAEAEREYEERQAGRPTPYSPTPGGPGYIPAPGGGQYPDYWDENGYLIHIDLATGDTIRVAYDPARATKPSPTPMPSGLFATWALASAAAPEGYEPYQLTTGYWGLKRKEGAGGITPAQQAELDLRQRIADAEERDRRARLEAERQARLDALRANPYTGWLQSGGTVQPWMLPLMAGQYPELRAGGAIPGYSPLVGQNMGGVAGPSLPGMPGLLSPSAQYWARMGPVAQQQYLGYIQARTGISPEEALFRQQSETAPSGRYPGLRWRR